MYVPFISQLVREESAERKQHRLTRSEQIKDICFGYKDPLTNSYLWGNSIFARRLSFRRREYWLVTRMTFHFNLFGSLVFLIWGLCPFESIRVLPKQSERIKIMFISFGIDEPLWFLKYNTDTLLCLFINIDLAISIVCRRWVPPEGLH